MSTGHIHLLTALVVISILIAWLLFAGLLDYILEAFDQVDSAEDFESEHYFAEEISDPWERIEAQDAEIIRLYSIIETLKEDIYLLRNIRHSEPSNAGSELRGNSTEGLTHSSALPDSGLDCA